MINKVTYGDFGVDKGFFMTNQPQIYEKISLAEFWKENYSIVIILTMISIDILCFSGIKDSFAIPLIGLFSLMSLLIVRALWYGLRKRVFGWSSYLLVLATALTAICAICFSIAIECLNLTSPSFITLAAVANPTLLIILSTIYNKQKDMLIN